MSLLGHCRCVIAHSAAAAACSIARRSPRRRANAILAVAAVVACGDVAAAATALEATCAFSDAALRLDDERLWSDPTCGAACAPTPERPSGARLSLLQRHASGVAVALVKASQASHQSAQLDAERPHWNLHSVVVDQTQQDWWSLHCRDGVAISIPIANLDFSRLAKDAALQELVVKSAREAVASELGTAGRKNITIENFDFVILSKPHYVVVRGVIHPTADDNALFLQRTLNSSHLRERLVREVEELGLRSALLEAPVSIVDIVVGTSFGQREILLRYPLAAVFLVCAAMIGLRRNRTKASYSDGTGSDVGRGAPLAGGEALLRRPLGPQPPLEPSRDARQGGEGEALALPTEEGSAELALTKPTRRADVGEKKTAEPEPPETPKIPLAALFRMATTWDKVQIAVSVVFSMLFGIALPMLFLLIRSAMGALFMPNDDGRLPPALGEHTLRDELVKGACYQYLGLAVVLFVTKAVGFMGIESAARRQTFALRRSLLEKVLNAGQAWHARRSPAELAEQIASDTQAFQQGIGEHFTNIIRVVSIASTCVVVSVVNEPRVGLVLAIGFLVTGWCVTVAREANESSVHVQQLAYVKAGGIAGTALSLVRTIAAFNGQTREVERYEHHVQRAALEGQRMGFVAGLSWGTARLSNLCSVAIGFYLAAFFVVRSYSEGCWSGGPPWSGCITGGTVLVSIFVTMRGLTATLASLPESIKEMAAAQAAAHRAFALLDELDGMPEDRAAGDGMQGLATSRQPATFARASGAVSFDQVTFTYPAAPARDAAYGEASLGAPALRSLSLVVPAGATAAFVGPSGSGKSTVLSLLLRFHDPQAGAILLDGRDLRSWGLACLRSQIALVDQEPVLFGCSIMDNILYGRSTATEEEAIAAAKSACAHDFVLELPQGYNTLVGERGELLSGGQKQRVALARAFLRDPAVLMLDEATSALDVRCEREVQAALDAMLAAKRRTTLVVTHRLSLAESADVIFVLQEGALVQTGTHEDLLEQPGMYAQLVSSGQPMCGAVAAPEALKASPESDLEGAQPAPEVFYIGDAGQNTPAPAPTGVAEPAPDASRGAAPPAAPPGGAQVAQQGPALPATPRPGAAEAELHLGLRRLFRLHAEHRRLVVVSLVATALIGASMPLFGRVIAEAANDFSRPPAVYHQALGVWVPRFDSGAIIGSAGRLCVALLIVGVVVCASVALSLWGLTKASEQLVFRLRVTGFSAMLRQDMGWLDNSNAGALSGQLASDVVIVKDLTCNRLASTVQSATMVMFGLTIMFLSCWALTLGLLSLMPFVAVLYWFVAPIIKRRRQRNKENTEAARSLLFQTLGNIRTVAAYGLEGTMVGRYVEMLRKQEDAVWSPFVVLGMGGPAAVALLLAVAVAGGGTLVSHNLMDPQDAMRVLMPLMWCTMGVFRGADFSLQQGAAAARVASLLNTIERKPTIDREGRRPVENVSGEVAFQGVFFQYPTRPGVFVLRGFSLQVEAHTTVALVGPSGCGKSTLLNLLLRFYDPDVGKVTLDGEDLRLLDVRSLRGRIGVVAQEPALFAGNVLENILYGRPGASAEAALEAAKAAGVHTFVSTLPRGYDTEVGERGAQLSGGQKQRIALARAIIRDPAILLLDEPTSSLDACSEREIQKALDGMLWERSRTMLVVAHRLSTIRAADKICVMDEGAIVESGTHEELLVSEAGAYRRLMQQQQRLSGD